MPKIRLFTTIEAPIERVFDLARSIDAHIASTKGTRERAIAGVTSGLIGMDQEVTWEARHLGKTRRMTVRITHFERPYAFRDVMVKGTFKRMSHDHRFTLGPLGTVMTERFRFDSPYGLLGTMANIVLTVYMRDLLERRNAALKRMAESDEWKKYLPPE